MALYVKYLFQNIFIFVVFVFNVQLLGVVVGENSLKTGWTKVDNKWLEVIMKLDLSGSELRLLLCVLRQTVGYGREEARISVAAAARLCSMSISAAKKGFLALQERELIARKVSPGRAAILSLHSTINTKKRLSTRPQKGPGTGTQKGPGTGTQKGPGTGTQKGPGTGTQKGPGLSLDTKKDIKDSASSIYLDVAQGYHKQIKKLHPSLCARFNFETDKRGSGELEKLVRLDGQDFEYIKAVLRWALQDSFWSVNLRSLATLRARGKNGATKFENCAAQYELTKPARAAHQDPDLKKYTMEYSEADWERVKAGNYLDKF